MTASRGSALSGLLAIIMLAAPIVPAAGQGTFEPLENPSPSFAGAETRYLARQPLEGLSATRDRPLFSPTRRPPPPSPLSAAPVLELPSQSAVKESPHLTLLGTIRSSTNLQVAVLLDETSQVPINLKVGDERRGWVLQSISGQGVTLLKNGLRETLAFPSSQAANPANGSGSATSAAGGSVQVAP